MTFPVTSKTTPPTVLNLQASDWVHCEEETGAYKQLSQFTYKLLKKIQIFKVYFSLKNSTFQKIPYNLLFIFSQKEMIGPTYICTKCNDNFKFSISQISYEE